MDELSELDLEDLETRLYSQVFFSSEKPDKIEMSPNGLDNGENLDSVRIETYSVNRKWPANRNRYWNNVNSFSSAPETTNAMEPSNSKHNNTNILMSCENITNSSVSPVEQSPNSSSKPCSSFPAKQFSNSTGNFKVNKYKHYIIPPTLELPLPNVQRLPDNIIKYFRLYTKERKRQFRKFLELAKKSQANITKNIASTATTATLTTKQSSVNLNKSQTNETENITSTTTTITAQNLNNLIESQTNETEKITFTTAIAATITSEQKSNNEITTLEQNSNNGIISKEQNTINVIEDDVFIIDNIEIIDLDNESDSVIEVPISPAPIIYLGSSDDENEELQIQLLDSMNSKLDDGTLLKKSNELRNLNKKSSSLNASDMQKQRDELLFTPDSTTNDFLENDVNNLTKKNYTFNFSLHTSDLDLSKEKEDFRSNSVINDIYDTESNCSEMSAAKPNHLNELSFETPAKDIFCEPNLTKFSKFITPNRKTTCSKFSPISSRASLNKKNKLENNQNQPDHSESELVTNKKKTKKLKKARKKETESNRTKELLRIEKSINQLEKETAENHSSELISNNLSLQEIYKDSCLIDEVAVGNEAQNTETNASKISETDVSGKQFSFMDSWRKLINTTNKQEEESILDILQATNDNKSDVVVISSSDDSNSIDSLDSGKKEKNYDDDDDNGVIYNFFIPPKLVKNSKSHVENRFSLSSDSDKERKCRSFQDCWTLDMNKFYDESWGEENFDLDSVLSSMPKERSKWKILIEDRLSEVKDNKKRGPRCLRCREFGHIAYNCYRFIGPVKCSLCAFPGHLETRCPNTFCTTCCHATESYTANCNNCAKYHFLICKICKTIGHLESECPDLWRRYHLTTENCEVVVRSDRSLVPPSQRWCSNCAKQGHLENGCNNYRRVHFPINPEIMSYQPVYVNDSETVNLPVSKLPSPDISLSDVQMRKRELIESNNKQFLGILKSLKRNFNNDDHKVKRRLFLMEQSIKTNKPLSKRKQIELKRLRRRILGTRR